jgi:hypothetical protein
MSKTVRYTSLNEILERVRRDFGFEEVYPDECKEWIWDAIGIMGSPDMLIDKTKVIQIYNHRGVLPVDVFDLTEHMLRETRTKEVMRYTENVYHLSDTISTTDPLILESGRSTGLEYNYTRTTEVDGSITESETTTESGSTSYISIIAPQYEYSSLDYNIKEDYIFTALKSMEVELSYIAFPMNEETMEPLIPNDPKTIRAVVGFIANKIAFRLMLEDKLSERKYGMIEQNYLFDTASAITRSRISTLPQLENFKNKVISIMKNHHPYRGAFKNSI